MGKVDLDTPLYFDKAHKKSNLSGERYAKYSSATTVGEYKARNPGAHMANDAQYDFKHGGHLRLLPLSAIPSVCLSPYSGLSSLCGRSSHPDPSARSR